MLKFIISFFILTIGFSVESDDTSTNEKTSKSSDRYIRVPISLDTNNFELRFGEEKSHEFTLSFGGASRIQKDHTHTTSRIEFINRAIWSDAEEAWVDDSFNQSYEDIEDYDNNYDYNFNLGIGYTKYFNTVQKERYDRSFYLSSSMQIAYSSSKSTKTESQTGYRIDVEPEYEDGETPAEGDYAGDYWVEDRVWVHTDIDAYSSINPAINFDIGTRFDVKSDLFNIKDLSLSFDIIWAGLNIYTSIYKDMDKKEYNCDIPIDKNIYPCSEDYRSTRSSSRYPDSVVIDFDGPSIGLFFKYNF